MTGRVMRRCGSESKKTGEEMPSLVYGNGERNPKTQKKRKRKRKRAGTSWKRRKGMAYEHTTDTHSSTCKL